MECTLLGWSHLDSFESCRSGSPLHWARVPNATAGGNAAPADVSQIVMWGAEAVAVEWLIVATAG